VALIMDTCINRNGCWII